MKEVFDELVKLGFFKKYRPFSILLFADRIREKTGAVLEINSDFEVELKNENWKIRIGDNISLHGKFSNEDYVRIAEAIAIAKAIVYNTISKEVLNYPLDPKIVWSAYNEALLFGMEEIGWEVGSPVDSKESFDFPGKYKLGAMFVGDYKKLSVDKKHLKRVLEEISYFFSNYSKLAYGKVEGEIDKFRFYVLALAKKGDFIAQRVYISLINGYPIKYTDFKHLKKKLNVNVKFLRSLEG